MSKTWHGPAREKRSSARKSEGSQFCSRVTENEDAILNIDNVVSLEHSTRVKFVMLWTNSKAADERVPDQKDIVSLLKNVALKNWQFAANAVPKHSELSQYIQKALICGVLKLKDVHIFFGWAKHQTKA